MDEPVACTRGGWSKFLSTFVKLGVCVFSILGAESVRVEFAEARTTESGVCEPGRNRVAPWGTGCLDSVQETWGVGSEWICVLSCHPGGIYIFMSLGAAELELSFTLSDGCR